MPINFPDSPSLNDTHTVGDKTWTWDGTAWTLVQNNVADHGNLGGLADDDHTQYLLADGTRTASELTVTNDLTVDTDTLHVDSTNNRVGIGTASPSQTLQLGETSGGLEPAIDLVSNGGRIIRMKAADSGNYLTVGSATAHSFALQTDNVRRLTIDSSGNVGINDTTPSYKLDVNGDINAQSTLRQAGAPIGMVRTMTVGIGNGVTVVDVPYCFSADYDNYLIQYRVDSATQGTQFSIKLMTGYTLSNSLYNNRLAYNFFSQAGMNTAQSTSHSNFYWLGGMRGGSGSSWHSGNGQFTLLNPHRTTYTVCHSDSYGADTTGGNMTGIHKYQGSYNGFRLLADIGTISGGRIDVYGYTL